MSKRGGSVRRAIVGGIFFSLFFQLFLPVAVAGVAPPGEPTRALELCGAGGIRLLSLDALPDGEAATAVPPESCILCFLHKAEGPGRDMVPDPDRALVVAGPAVFERTIPFHSRYHITSDVTARAPPGSRSFPNDA